jgi:hypothetical protein
MLVTIRRRLFADVEMGFQEGVAAGQLEDGFQRVSVVSRDVRSETMAPAIDAVVEAYYRQIIPTHQAQRNALQHCNDDMLPACAY